MEPNIWGPSAWKFLHSITFQYPENPTDLDKQKYFTFFNSLKNVLPCPTCREHYGKSFETVPIRLDNRKELIEWLIDIHNKVNLEAGKKVYSYSEVYQIYNDMYDIKNNVSGTSDYLVIILLVIVAIAAYYYYNEVYLKK
jgi:hypothetical protein